MICRKCGAQIPDNSSVCGFCGAEYEVAPVIEETPENEVVGQEERMGIDTVQDETDQILDENERNRMRQAQRLNAEKQAQLEEIARRREAKKRRQIRNRLLIGLAVIAVLGAAAAGVNQIRKHKDDVPEVVVVSHEPAEETPAVATAPDETEDNAVETADNTEAAAAAPVSGGSAAASAGGTGNTSWRSTGGGGSTGSSAAGLAPASSGTSSSTTKASTGSSGSAAKSSSATSNAAASTSKSAFNGSSFKSALVTGGAVESTGSGNVMSFNYGGKTYYAKVSSDTTTAFVNSKPMTISATQSGETYNGAPVYNITAITNYNGNYMFAESGYKLLTEADLEGKSAWELMVGRNEIYARHGRQFKDQALQAHFNGCAWYKPDPSYNTDNDAEYLNEIELKNATFILEYEKNTGK